MITGSGSFSQIFDPEEKSVTLASPLNTKRYGYGMGIITINGEDKLAVVCGIDKYEYDDLDSVELYNAEKKEWETTDIKLKEQKHSFAFLTIRLYDIVRELNLFVNNKDCCRNGFVFFK